MTWPVTIVNNCIIPTLFSQRATNNSESEPIEIDTADKASISSEGKSSPNFLSGEFPYVFELQGRKYYIQKVSYWDNDIPYLVRDENGTAFYIISQKGSGSLLPYWWDEKNLYLSLIFDFDKGKVYQKISSNKLKLVGEIKVNHLNQRPKNVQPPYLKIEILPTFVDQKVVGYAEPGTTIIIKLWDEEKKNLLKTLSATVFHSGVFSFEFEDSFLRPDKYQMEIIVSREGNQNLFHQELKIKGEYKEIEGVAFFIEEPTPTLIQKLGPIVQIIEKINRIMPLEKKLTKFFIPENGNDYEGSVEKNRVILNSFALLSEVGEMATSHEISHYCLANMSLTLNEFGDLEDLMEIVAEKKWKNLSNLWLFDESSYWDIPESIGHPTTRVGELFASGATVLKYRADEFLKNVSSLSPEQQKWAKKVARRIVTYFTSRGLKDLFPANLLEYLKHP